VQQSAERESFAGDEHLPALAEALREFLDAAGIVIDGGD
jgi:hypothetical protein